MQNFDFYHPGPPGAGYYPYYAPQFIPRPLDQQQQQQAQQPLASSGVEKSTKQKKREHWSAEQTDALMSQWIENFDIVESKDANKAWSFILKVVNEHGPQRNITQVKKKFAKMKDTYKKCKDANKNKTGEGLNTCPYYEEFDKLLCQRESVNLPEFAEIGAAEIVVTAPDEANSVATVEKHLDDIESESFDRDIDEVAIEGQPDDDTPVKSGKRKVAEENLNTSFQYYEELKGEVKRKKEQQTKEKEKKKTSFHEELIEIQKQQMEMFKQSEKQFQEFQKSFLEKQLEADAKEKENHRKFFLEFAKILSGTEGKAAE